MSDSKMHTLLHIISRRMCSMVAELVDGDLKQQCLLSHVKGRVEAWLLALTQWLSGVRALVPCFSSPFLRNCKSQERKKERKAVSTFTLNPKAF